MFLIVLVLSSVVAPREAAILEQELVCDVVQFGASGNGHEFDTEPIQAAIDYCAEWSNHRQKKSSVVFPSGKRFLTATLHLKSFVNLVIHENSSIIGSSKLESFPKSRDRWYTILGENVTNVSVTGSGTVDGQGLKFVEKFKDEKNVMVSWNKTGQCLGDECRPRLIGFLDSTNVHLSDLHFNQPAYWCIHLVRCNKVAIFNISILGDFNSPNNDGIDVDGSNNTVISNVKINTGDDAICPKSTAGPITNLTVVNSWIRTKSCAIKLGSGSENDFRNLHFENIDIVDSHRGLGIQLRDEGSVYNVTFKNLRVVTRYYHPSWWGRAEPIYVTACPRTKGTKVGKIYDVRFVEVSARSENGVFIAGDSRSHIGKISVQNFSLTLSRWTNYTGGYHDYRPGCRGLVTHVESVVFLDYAERVEVENVAVKVKSSMGRDLGTTVDISPLVQTFAVRNFSCSVENVTGEVEFI